MATRDERDAYLSEPCPVCNGELEIPLKDDLDSFVYVDCSYCSDSAVLAQALRLPPADDPFVDALAANGELIRALISALPR